MKVTTALKLGDTLSVEEDFSVNNKSYGHTVVKIVTGKIIDFKENIPVIMAETISFEDRHVVAYVRQPQ